MLTFLSFPLALIAVGVQPDTIQGQIVARIAENSPRTQFLIGEVSGLAIDDSGHVYVTDFQEPRVLVFTRDGRHLATIGWKGRGPGEFTAPTGPALGPDGALYVRNMEAVSRFVRNPSTGLPTVFDRVFAGPVMAPWRSKLPSIIDRAGRFHFPVEVGVPQRQPGVTPAAMLTYYAYWRYSLDGQRLDSLPVPLYPTTRSSWADYQGRVIRGLNVVPFHPTPAWTVSGAGTLISGPADRYELLETDSLGQIQGRMSRPVRATRIPAGERAESLRALKRRIDSLPVPVSQVRGASDEVRAQRLPDTYPAYQGVLVTPAGDVWVRRWAPPELRDTTILDVLSAGGTYRHTIVLPVVCASQPALAVRGTTVACVEVDADSGAESVVLLRLPPTGG